MIKTSSDITFRVMDIVDGTTVDGPGFRTSIYFSGCEHHCPQCHNPSTWSHDAGAEMTLEQLILRIKENDLNVTFSGGDPMFQIDSILILAKEICALGKTIWCYTGFTFEQVASHPKMSELLKYIEVLVDGPFVNDLRDTDLLFRGSSNQRLILAQVSKKDAIKLWHPIF